MRLESMHDSALDRLLGYLRGEHVPPRIINVLGRFVSSRHGPSHSSHVSNDSILRQLSSGDRILGILEPEPINYESVDEFELPRGVEDYGLMIHTSAVDNQKYLIGEVCKSGFQFLWDYIKSLGRPISKPGNVVLGLALGYEPSAVEDYTFKIKRRSNGAIDFTDEETRQTLRSRGIRPDPTN